MCGICGKLDKNSLCPKCNLKLKKISMYNIEDYKESSSFFDEHIYFFQYSGEIRNAMLNYKFREKSYIYKTFIQFLKNDEKIWLQIKKYDIIIPVPISKKRLKERGYNQSELIAKEIAKVVRKEICSNILIKKKENKKQSELNQDERIKNVQGVYKVINVQKIKDKTVLLVDDIFTTGNTVNECSKALIQAGAKKIGICTIAKD